MKNTWFIRNSYWLFFLMFLSIPAGRAVLHIVLTFSFLAGGYFFLKKPGYFWGELKKSRLLYVYALLTIPIMIASIDSLNPEGSLSTVLSALRYSGFFILSIIIVQDRKYLHKLTTLMYVYIIFICFDALCQWLFGFNIYGENPALGRVKGIFGKEAHLSFYLATLSPIFFLYSLQNVCREKTLFMSVLLCITPILLLVIFIGGARTGIVTLLVSLLMIVIWLWKENKILYKKAFLTIMPLFIIFVTIIALNTDVFQYRYLNRVIESDSVYEVFNKFSTNRLALWEITIRAFPDYWLNGIGTRAFDAVYRLNVISESYLNYSYIHHSHLHILEVMIETGLIGLTGYLIVLYYLFYKIFTARAGVSWLMVAFLAMMPINSHVGFYETYWMPMIWIPLALGLAQAYQADLEKDHKPSCLF